MPINSKSGSQAAGWGEMCVWKLNCEPVRWEEHSCWVSTSFNSYGWFRTFQYKSPNPHISQKKLEGFSTALQGMKLLQKSVSKSQHEPQHPRLFWKHESVFESAIWSLSGENLASPQMSAFQDLRKTAFFWTCRAMLFVFCFLFYPMELWKGFTSTKSCRVLSANRKMQSLHWCIKTGVTRFSHDDTDILLYKAFMRSSVLSSAPALLFPLIGTLQLHGLWACPILLFQWLCGFFSVFFWAAAQRPADPQPSDTEEIVIWDETPLITLASQPTHIDKLRLHIAQSIARWPKRTSCDRRHGYQGNKEISHVLMSRAVLKLRTPSQDIKQTNWSEVKHSGRGWEVCVNLHCTQLQIV